MPYLVPNYEHEPILRSISSKTEKNYYLLVKFFSVFYFGTLNLHALKLLVKILLVGFFEAVN